MADAGQLRKYDTSVITNGILQEIRDFCELPNGCFQNLIQIGDWGADGDQIYLGKDGLLHGREGAPDFKTLIEWYFCGALEEEYEQENDEKPTYEWYQNL